MKTAQVENGILVIKESDKETLANRKGAICKVLGCGLCGSDIVKLSHNLAKDGTVLGHEIVAKIVEIDSDTGFCVGDVIVTSHHINCGKCEYWRCRYGCGRRRVRCRTDLYPDRYSFRGLHFCQLDG